MQEEYEKIHSAAVKFISFRPRSRWEVEQYLAKKGYAEEMIPAALERLEQAGIVDDGAFAESWIGSRQSLKPRSKRVLEQELMAKRVSRDVIATALSEIDEDAENEALMRVIDKKRRLPQFRDSEKLTGYLLRQGYTMAGIKKALMRLDE